MEKEGVMWWRRGLTHFDVFGWVHAICTQERKGGWEASGRQETEAVRSATHWSMEKCPKSVPLRRHAPC